MINLNIILRDENPTIMNKYLTNGKSSIPKLIVKNSAQQELFRWGPRPNKIQKKVEIFKKSHPKMDKNEFNKELHLWYAKNKTLVLQEDFKLLLQKIQ